jgi:hypothetical protein
MTETTTGVVPGEKCAACGGKSEDHGPGKSQHVFTTKPGELKTHEQAAKEQSRSPAGVIRLTPPASSPGAPAALHPTMMDRLLEVLMSRDLLTRDEALYVATGIQSEQPR